MRELELLIEEILMNVSRYSYPEDAPGMVTVSYSVPHRASWLSKSATKASNSIR